MHGNPLDQAGSAGLSQPARYYGANATRILNGPRLHGLKETEAEITMKLKRGTFAATFFLACLAAMELEGVVLDEI